MPSTVYLVTGGARSGKSSYAERLCERLCPTPIYLATSGPKFSTTDSDFAQRIKRHQDDRASRCCWETIEEPLKPSLHTAKFKGKVVLVDCLTMWLTNMMMEEGVFSIQGDECTTVETSNSKVTEASERALTKIKKEFDTLTDQWGATFVFVTNELGSGTHGETHLTRKFVDAQGWFNQHVASKAKRVIHTVCGVPNVIKDDTLSSSSSNDTNAILSKEKMEDAKMLDQVLSSRQLPMDAKGYFMLKTDPTECLIIASFHSCIVNDKGEVCDLEGNKIKCHDKTNRPEPMKVWKCRTAKELTVEIFERWSPAAELVSVGHAAYIGREAQRAEECLYRLGQHYQQD